MGMRIFLLIGMMAVKDTAGLLVDWVDWVIGGGLA
jgi:hypothetical protein